MKKTIKIFIVPIITSLVILCSCNKEQSFSKINQSDKNVEASAVEEEEIEIYEDLVFHQIIMDRLLIINSISETNGNNIMTGSDPVNTILSSSPEGVLTDDKKIQLAELFGFSTYAGLHAYIVDLENKLKYLNNTYGYSSFTDDEISSAASLYNPNDFGDIYACPPDPDCKGIYGQCMASVQASQVLGHTGCNALALALPAMLACHGAVLLVAVVGTNSCNSSYDNCTGKSSQGNSGNGGYGSYHPYNGGLSTVYSLPSNLSHLQNTN